MTTADYFQRVPESTLHARCRRWNGNDTSNQSQHGAVRLSESPLDLRLTWKMRYRAPEHLVGCFRLNLDRLLQDGYIREDTKPGEVRLRFARDGDGIYIRANDSSPAIWVGTFPLARAAGVS